MSMVVHRLLRQKALYNQEPSSLSKFVILKAREAFRQNPPPNLPSQQYGVVEGDFAVALSLYHGYELLQLHGLHSLYKYLDGIVSGEKGHGRARTELLKCDKFHDIMSTLRTKFTQDESNWSCTERKNNYVFGHPKMKKLEEVVLEHFRKVEQAGEDNTRVMIFSQFRDSVQEIRNLLNLHQPRVKAMIFIGQSSAGKATRGFTQKEQLKVMKEFREGGYNTLISTCVGEEGLDIGDVDLIICFDAHKSPIRLVQRMGRTGRKRQGRIVMLVTEGKEEQIYNQSQYSKRSIHKAIMNGAQTLHFYQGNPHMLPDGITPVCHKMFITVKQVFNAAEEKVNHNPKKFNIFRKGASKDDTVTVEEYRDLQEYLVLKNQFRHMSVQSGTLLCLDQCQQDSDCEELERSLSLNEWMPWQNRLQNTNQVDNTHRSRHLVELIEFLQLQENLPNDEDHYGVEMEIFLHLEDVLQPGEEEAVMCEEEKWGIFSFCNTFKQPSSIIRDEHDPVSQRILSAGVLKRLETLPIMIGCEEEGEENQTEFHVGIGSDCSQKEAKSVKEDSLVDKVKKVAESCKNKRYNKKIMVKQDKVGNSYGKGKNGKKRNCKDSLLQQISFSDEDEEFGDVTDADVTNNIKEHVEAEDHIHVMDIDLDTDKLDTKRNFSMCQDMVEGRSFTAFGMEQFKIKASPSVEEMDEVRDVTELTLPNLVQLVSDWSEETHGKQIRVVWMGHVSDDITLESGPQWDYARMVSLMTPVTDGGKTQRKPDERYEIFCERNISLRDGREEISGDNLWSKDNFIQFDLGVASSKSNDFFPEIHSFTIVKSKVTSEKENIECSFEKKDLDVENSGKSSQHVTKLYTLSECKLNKRDVKHETMTSKVRKPIQENGPSKANLALFEQTDKVQSKKILKKKMNELFPSSHQEKGNTSSLRDECTGKTMRSPQETITFTQALACVHSSEDCSPNQGHEDLVGGVEKRPGTVTVGEVDIAGSVSCMDTDTIVGEMLRFNMFDDAFDEHKQEHYYPAPKSPQYIPDKSVHCENNTSSKADVTSGQALDLTQPLVFSGEHQLVCSTVLGNPAREYSMNIKALDEAFDMPNFDLEFDHDIIPPSPLTSQPFSQMSFSWSHSACVSCRMLEPCFQHSEQIIYKERLVDMSTDTCKRQDTSHQQNNTDLSTSNLHVFQSATVTNAAVVITGQPTPRTPHHFSPRLSEVQSRATKVQPESSTKTIVRNDQNQCESPRFISVTSLKTARPCGDSPKVPAAFRHEDRTSASFKTQSRPATRQRKKKMKTRKVCSFLDAEAVLSGSDASSDNIYKTDNDYLEASFVNDNSLMSQSDVTDMQAVYLKSLHRPDYSDHHFHLVSRHYSMDVFSQGQEEDKSQYHEDSFCVAEDHEDTEYIEEDDFDEFSCYWNVKRKKLTKAKPSKTLDGKFRRRIYQISNSSSEEENLAVESVLEDTTIDHTTNFLSSKRTDPVLQKATVIMSSSEDDTSPRLDTKSAGDMYRQK